jgi:hypothetical protein
MEATRRCTCGTATRARRHERQSSTPTSLAPTLAFAPTPAPAPPHFGPALIFTLSHRALSLEPLALSRRCSIPSKTTPPRYGLRRKEGAGDMYS